MTTPRFGIIITIFVVIVIIATIIVICIKKRRRHRHCSKSLVVVPTPAISTHTQVVPLQKKQQKNYIFCLQFWGGFGNNMHQVAFACTYAAKHHLDVILPKHWMGTYMFEQPKTFNIYYADDVPEARDILNQMNGLTHKSHTKHDLELVLEKYKYTNWSILSNVEHSKNVYDYTSSGGNVIFLDLAAYNQEIFTHMNLNMLQNEIFVFSKTIRELETYDIWEKRKGTYSAVHVRRGDSVKVNWFIQIDIDSYKNKINSNNSNNNNNLIWVSDDMKLSTVTSGNHKTKLGWKIKNLYEKYFKPKTGWHWNGLGDALEDFLILVFARTVYRANSSFSFWASVLNPYQDIYSPDLTKINPGKEKQSSYHVDFINSNQPHWFASSNVQFSIQNMK